MLKAWVAVCANPAVLTMSSRASIYIVVSSNLRQEVLFRSLMHLPSYKNKNPLYHNICSQQQNSFFRWRQSTTISQLLGLLKPAYTMGLNWAFLPPSAALAGAAPWWPGSSSARPGNSPWHCSSRSPSETHTQNSSSYSGVRQACNKRNIFAVPSAQACLETDYSFLVNR